MTPSQEPSPSHVALGCCPNLLFTYKAALRQWGHACPHRACRSQPCLCPCLYVILAAGSNAYPRRDQTKYRPFNSQLLLPGCGYLAPSTHVLGSSSFSWSGHACPSGHFLPFTARLTPAPPRWGDSPGRQPQSTVLPLGAKITAGALGFRYFKARFPKWSLKG